MWLGSFQIFYFILKPLDKKSSPVFLSNDLEYYQKQNNNENKITKRQKAVVLLAFLPVHAFDLLLLQFQ